MTLDSYKKSYINSCINSYIRSYIYSYINSNKNRYIKSCIKRYINSYINSYINCYTKSFMKSYINSYINSCIESYINRSFQIVSVILSNFRQELLTSLVSRYSQKPCQYFVMNKVDLRPGRVPSKYLTNLHVSKSTMFLGIHLIKYSQALYTPELFIHYICDIYKQIYIFIYMR